MEQKCLRRANCQIILSLSRRNAIELRHSRFTDDIRHLLEQTGLSAFEKPSNFVELEKTFSALGDVPLRQIGFIFSSFFFWIWTRLSSFYGLTASLLSSLQGLTRDVADKIGWQKSLLLFSIVLSATFYYLFGRFVLRPIAMVLHGFVPYSTPTATGFASAIALMAAALVIFSTCLDLTSLPRKCIKIFVYSLCFSYLFGFMSNAIEDGLMQIRQATLHGRIVDSSVKLGASDLGYGALRPFEIFDNPFGRNIYAQSGREAEGNLLSPDQPETDRLERCPVEESYLCYKYGVSRNIVYFAHFKTTDTSYPFYDMDTAFDSAAGLSLNSLVAIQEIKNFGAVFTTWLVSYILYLFFVFWLWRIMGRSRKRLDAARRLFAGTI